MDKQLATLAGGVRAIIFDVDGVLTDGRIIYSADGSELKQFHVQDGASLKLMMQQGLSIGIITGRHSPMVQRRADELGISYLKQGAARKDEALAELIEDGFPGTGIAAVGDDLQDLDLFAHPGVAFHVTVANAHPAVKERAHFVTQRRGGDGVCVEIAQLILTAQNKWPY